MHNMHIMVWILCYQFTVTKYFGTLKKAIFDLKNHNGAFQICLRQLPWTEKVMQNKLYGEQFNM